MVAAYDRRVRRDRFEHRERKPLLELPTAGDDQKISRFEAPEHVGIWKRSEKFDLLFDSKARRQMNHRLEFPPAGKRELDVRLQTQVGDGSNDVPDTLLLSD